MATSPHQQFSLGDFMSPAALLRQAGKMVQPNTVTGVWFYSWSHMRHVAVAHTPSQAVCFSWGHSLTPGWPREGKTSQIRVLLCTGQCKSQKSHRRKKEAAAPTSASEGFGPWPLLALSGKLKRQSGKEQEGLALCYYLLCQQQPKQISRCPNSRACPSEPASQLFTIYLLLISS